MNYNLNNLTLNYPQEIKVIPDDRNNKNNSKVQLIVIKRTLTNNNYTSPSLNDLQVKGGNANGKTRRKTRI